MSLQAAYKQFLAAPTSSALAADASLHYITTTTSFHGPTDIIKHLSSQRNQLKKKKEDILNVIEGRGAIAVETETALEFVSSGGAYLPGMDDNFLADRTVYIPITHIVIFNGEGRIARIRQSWDQGALLKQLDVIGRSGRNWPIRDSTEQIKLIVQSTGKPAEEAPSHTVNHSRGNSNNAMRDPHTTLNLFAPREERQPIAVVAPYAGNRPPQRTFEDILGDEDDEDATGTRPQSPSKVVAPKAGAGKNYQPSRLFDAGGANATSDPNMPEQSPQRFYRPHPTKYDHFDIADGSDPADRPPPGGDLDKRSKSKHDGHFSFDDFVTPQKAHPTRGLRSQDVHHWSTEANEAQEEQPRRPAVPKSRRDADAHFEMRDGSLPSDEPRAQGRPRGAVHNDGSEPAEDSDPHALGTITNLKDRSQTFARHFDMADESPRDSNQPKHAPHIGEDRENGLNHRIIVAGDGMGNRKGAHSWSIGYESGEERSPSVPGRKQGTTQGRSSLWDY